MVHIDKHKELDNFTMMNIKDEYGSCIATSGNS